MQTAESLHAVGPEITGHHQSGRATMFNGKRFPIELIGDHHVTLGQPRQRAVFQVAILSLTGEFPVIEPVGPEMGGSGLTSASASSSARSTPPQRTLAIRRVGTVGFNGLPAH